jgi:predicted solute-binding protein
MRTKIETIVEYPNSYPRTAECEQYLQLRAKHEDEKTKRAAKDVLAALTGTSGLNNAGEQEEFRKIQYAYHDCQMTALSFFSAQKSMTVVDIPTVHQKELTNLRKS